MLANFGSEYCPGFQNIKTMSIIYNSDEKFVKSKFFFSNSRDGVVKDTTYQRSSSKSTLEESFTPQTVNKVGSGYHDGENGDQRISNTTNKHTRNSVNPLRIFQEA